MVQCLTKIAGLGEACRGSTLPPRQKKTASKITLVCCPLIFTAKTSGPHYCTRVTSRILRYSPSERIPLVTSSRLSR